MMKKKKKKKKKRRQLGSKLAETVIKINLENDTVSLDVCAGTEIHVT
jgi:hypothetical protein